MECFLLHFPGHFLLTHLLLDELKTSAPSRVINITALAYQLGEINFDDINLEEQEVFKPGTAYSQSKLAMMLFTYKIAKYLEGMATTKCTHVQPTIYVLLKFQSIYWRFPVINIIGETCLNKTCWRNEIVKC